MAPLNPFLVVKAAGEGKNPVAIRRPKSTERHVSDRQVMAQANMSSLFPGKIAQTGRTSSTKKTAQKMQKI